MQSDLSYASPSRQSETSLTFRSPASCFGMSARCFSSRILFDEAVQALWEARRCTHP